MAYEHWLEFPSLPGLGIFNLPAVLLVLAALQLSSVRSETDWSEFKPKECRAVVKGRGRTPGLCVPLSWCPPLAAAAGRGQRPRSCGFHDITVLVCCPSGDVVSQEPSNTGTVSARQPPVDLPRNEPGCGAVVDDPGLVKTGPSGVRLSRSPWPWMVAIYKGPNYLCGGTLLDANTVLTAAHCFRDKKDVNAASMYKIRLGVLDVNETVSAHSTNVPVRWIRPHEDYRADRHYYDIALIKMADRVTYGSHISPVCLPMPDLKLGGQVVVLGWGHTAFGGRYSYRLQEGRVAVISNQDCDEILSQANIRQAIPDGVHEHFVCAVNHTGVDACQGDSGGPLLALGADFRWALAGVVSFGIGCGGRFPGAYTRVTTFLDWIARHRD